MDIRPLSSADRVGLRIDFGPHRIWLSGSAQVRPICEQMEVAAIDVAETYQASDAIEIAAEVVTYDPASS